MVANSPSRPIEARAGGRLFAGPSHLPDDPQPTTAGASQDPDHHQTSAPEKPWPRHSPVSGRRPPVRSLDHVAALRGHASPVIAATTARARLGRPRGRLMANPPAVLLGGITNALSVARGLGTIGVKSHAVGPPNSPVSASRHCASFMAISEPDVQRKTFDWLLDSAPRGAVLLPCDDDSLELVVQRRRELVDVGHMPIYANDDVVGSLLDKERTYDIARSCNVGAPRTVTLRSASDLEHGLREHAEQRQRAVSETDQSAPERRAGHESARAIDRIDVPRIVRVSGPLAFLFRDDAMLWITLDDGRAQHAFDRTVGARYRIESRAAFVLDRERTSKVRLRDPAGGARELQREVFELDNGDSFHADIIEACRSSCLVHPARPEPTDGARTLATRRRSARSRSASSS